MAATAAFASTPKNALIQVSTANTNFDGSGTLGTLLTVGANGAYIKKIVATAAEATTAGCVRIFLSIDGGSTKRLIGEIAIAAATPSATVRVATGTLTLNEVLPAAAILYASTHNAEDINVRCEYGEY